MAKKINKVSKAKIVDWYTNYVLENGEQPPTVYFFAKKNGFSESEFYQYFGSFNGVEEAFYELLFENTYDLVKESAEFTQADARGKLLTFYFTFFENMTANRSFVQQSIGEHTSLRSLKKLRLLRQSFRDMIGGFDIETLDLKEERLNKAQQQAIKESAWFQLLATVKFWLNDTSPGFEKTDIFIEKAVNTSFDLMDVKPIRSLVDFGKFLLKEQTILKA